VNTTGEEKKIAVDGTRKGLITHRVYSGTVTLAPQDADLIE
jgi:hypothetical protein